MTTSDIPSGSGHYRPDPELDADLQRIIQQELADEAYIEQYLLDQHERDAAIDLVVATGTADLVDPAELPAELAGDPEADFTLQPTVIRADDAVDWPGAIRRALDELPPKPERRGVSRIEAVAWGAGALALVMGAAGLRLLLWGQL